MENGAPDNVIAVADEKRTLRLVIKLASFAGSVERTKAAFELFNAAQPGYRFCLAECERIWPPPAPESERGASRRCGGCRY